MKITILTTLFVLLALLSCTKTDNFENERFSFVSQFGGNGSVEGIIGRARNISQNFKGEILIPDLGAANIKIFDSSGNHVRTFGKRGRGPGEFSGNLVIDTRNDTITVYDATNYKVNFYTNEGNFISTFQVDNRFASQFEFAKGEILVAGSKAAAFQTELVDEKLFHVFDFRGNPITQFGEFPSYGTDVPAIIYSNTFEIINNKLHVLFTYLPLYQIYDMNDYTLVQSIDLTSFDTFDSKFNNSDLPSNPSEVLNNENGLVSYAGGLSISENDVFFFTDSASEDDLIVRRFNLVNDSLEFIELIRIPKNDDALGLADLTYSYSNNTLNVLVFSTLSGHIVKQYLLK